MGWRRSMVMILGLVIGGSLPDEAAACSNYRTDSVFVGASIGLRYDADQAGTQALLEEAVAMWQGCHNYGLGFPEFLIGEAGTRTLRIEYLPEVAGDEKCGSFGQEQITIYGYQRLGDDLYSCGDLVQNLAHELGHALGLSEAGTAQRCQLHVMAWINPDNAFRRAVQPGECMAAGQRWLTFDELGAVQASRDLRVASLTVGR